ncbi:serendipity locus protein delta-like [Lucilia cuprina]|uniref:serendipity locus protein delta-like n=1 Tax=Lucilia cuprina TaxID=7375 RepID=UPI001F05B52A|nr:serendipity locus protein delta-like [Lucilia cuprina]
MSGVVLEFNRCFLCRKKNTSDKFQKRIDVTQCPASKKSIRTVLLHLARLGKFELHLPSGEWLCRKCYFQIADYDSNLVNVTRKQRNLSMLVEKAATSFESDIEDECLQEMSSMAELNDDHFFEDANVSDHEISETIFDVIGGDNSRKRKQDNDQFVIQSVHSVSQHRPVPLSEQIQCNLCAMRFKNRARLQRHVVQAHKKFSCDVCSFSHRNEDYVMLHMNIHEGKNENQCRFCNKEFTTKISTIRHMEVHLDTKKYQCDKCGLCFSQTTVLYNHKLQHEAEEKPLRCEICNQIFKTKRTFRHHMVTHRADRPRYSCEFCFKTFTEKYTLKVHKRTHPEAGVPAASTNFQYQQQQQQEHQYQVESEPHQSFNQNHVDYLQTTNLQATNSQTTSAAPAIPKFSCIICDQPFTTKDHLNKHMEKEHDVILKSLTIANFSQFEVVTNEPRKPCHICGQIFSAQHNLEYHLENVHGVSFK